MEHAQATLESAPTFAHLAGKPFEICGLRRSRMLLDGSLHASESQTSVGAGLARLMDCRRGWMTAQLQQHRRGIALLAKVADAWGREECIAGSGLRGRC
mmetsp:Transcript_15626/g.49874  ORF Transcript_15626/g.49874 Transcript_15626/m.49874 type:complete len:99 (-) Transcript_15626:68-364(-)